MASLAWDPTLPDELAVALRRDPRIRVYDLERLVGLTKDQARYEPPARTYTVPSSGSAGGYPGAWLYRNFHSLHHKSYNPNAWDGMSMHPGRRGTVSGAVL